MREILFRGKTTKKNFKCEFNNTWVYGDLIYSDGKCYIHPQADRIKVHGEFGEIIIMHEVIPETVGQYTGGNIGNDRIFDGDILQNATGIFVVSWDEHFMDWILLTDKGVRSFALATALREKRRPYKKIGNMHDNPELLEVEK